MIKNSLAYLPWNLSEVHSLKENSPTVFSCFCGGGGSTMGYKISGFNVLGGVEIDKSMANIYRKNHKPKFFYNCSVDDFNLMSDSSLPKELFNLDVLDGSPPCSSFSMAGKREKDWGKNKKFREGQAFQVLDDLFFSFVRTAKKLSPKVVVAENVKGMLSGKARGYIKEVNAQLNSIGYVGQIFLLNSATMGVPQSRERVFLVYNRLGKKLTLNFNEKPLAIADVISDKEALGKELNTETMAYEFWHKTKRGRSFSHAAKGSWFSNRRLNKFKPCPTITGNSKSDLYHWDSPNSMSQKFFQRCQSFPEDYLFDGLDAGYVCGMSVPPLMMNRISLQIKEQLL